MEEIDFFGEYYGGSSSEAPPAKFGGATVQSDPVVDKLVPTNISEHCSLPKVVLHGQTDVCVDPQTLQKIGSNLGATGEPKQVMKSAMMKLKCDTQQCVLAEATRGGILARGEAERELKYNFKIKGPRDTALLSNVDIDTTLNQWQEYFKDSKNKFYHYNFNMYDYEDRGDSLATVDIKKDIYDKGYRTFACVINSDRYSGRGKHWMALFGDMRGDQVWTVEFFNSSGQPPASPFAKWLRRVKERYEDIFEAYGFKNKRAEIIKVCDIEHQKSKTECGVYSLLYIWGRLNGVPYSYFKENAISDILCFEFRQSLFDDPKYPHMERFDYDAFMKFGKGPSWEYTVSKAELKRMEALAKPKGSPGGNKSGGNPREETSSGNVELTKKYLPMIFKTDKEREELKVEVPFSLKLEDNTRRLPYRSIPQNLRFSLHWGQRKLLLTEILFLTLCGDLSDTFVYAGAAPGDHIPYLAELFPKHKFILWDPSPFHIEEDDRIEIHRDFMTDEVAELYKGKDVLFASDIRVGTEQKSELPQQAVKDMKNQKRWVLLMNPKASMLKFVLPYESAEEEATEYLDGTLYIQPWAPKTSTETRLISVRGKTGFGTRDFKHLEYEERLFRFNLITRIWQYFPHDVEGEGIDHCWDCRAEIEILSMYLGKHRPELPKEDYPKVISAMSKKMSRVISKVLTLVNPPHGVYKELSMMEKAGILIEKYSDLLIKKKQRKEQWRTTKLEQVRPIFEKHKEGGAETTLYLVRHGETPWNAQGVIQGKGTRNLEMNERGKTQVGDLGEKLKDVKFDVVYASPYKRTVHTANAILDKNAYGETFAEGSTGGIIYLESLGEFDTGDLEGLTKEEALVHLLEVGLVDALAEDFSMMKPEFKAPGGESHREYKERITDAIKKIVKENPGKTILIVGHGGMCIFGNQLAEPEASCANGLSNASYSVIKVVGDDLDSPESYRLVSWNSSS